MSEVRYFPFPICLLNDAFSNIHQVCDDIMSYAIYWKSLDESGKTEIARIKKAAKFFSIILGNESRTLQGGKKIYNCCHNKPKSSGNIDVLFDFYKNEKTEYEIACFVAYHALKSIVGKKAYCKVTNRFLLARMAGYSTVDELPEELPEPLDKYSKRWQLDKIKTELKLSWGVKIYARYTRGFYVSFSLSLEKLILEAEKRRKQYIHKQLAEKERKAVQKVKNQLTTP